MILKDGLIDFQAEFARNSVVGPVICEQKTNKLDWSYFCQNEKIEEGYYHVNLKDLREMNSVGKTQISKWMATHYENIIFYGGPGSGKTHAGLAILRHYFEKGLHVRHIHDYEVIPKGKKEGVDYLKQIYGECDLLMVDDFGLSSIPEWEIQNYFSIIDMRFNRRKPTIITTNLNETELSRKLTERIVSRIPGQWVLFEDMDNRSLGFKGD